MSNKVYFHKHGSDLLKNSTYSDIQPGDIILMTAVGAHRKARKHDNAIMLLQALFRGKYHMSAKYNHRISHAIICVGSNKDGSPIIAEIVGGGFNQVNLTSTFFHTWDTDNAFRPMHVFRPSSQTFRDELVNQASNAYEIWGDKNPNWSYKKGALSLFGRARKKNSQGITKDPKAFSMDTHCASFLVRSMKNAARKVQDSNYFPDLHTNVTPASLYSYLTDQVKKGHFTQSTHVDIDPFDGVKDVIEKQIFRLQNMRRSPSANKKADDLRIALDKALQNIVQDSEPLTQANQLLDQVKSVLANKRTNFNPFRKATSLVEVQQYMKRVDRYVQELKW